MGVAEVRRLRVLEEENKKLKQLVADLSLDKQMLLDVLLRKPRSLVNCVNKLGCSSGCTVQVSGGHVRNWAFDDPPVGTAALQMSENRPHTWATSPRMNM